MQTAEYSGTYKTCGEVINTVSWPNPNRDVSEPAKIQSRRIRISYFKSVGFEFGFVTRSQLVQLNEVKNNR